MPKFEYEYYVGDESEQFRFLKIPKVFFEDLDYLDLGLAECVVYGFLHEQVAFSKQNGWVDEAGKTYVIRSLKSIQKLLHGCSADKARATLKNLIAFGLIEKKRRGQGKPDIIYVKNFVSKKSGIPSSEKKDDCGNHFSEVGKTEFLNAEKPIPRDGDSLALEVGNSASINPYNDIQSIMETDLNLIPSIGNAIDAEPVDNFGWDEDVIRKDIAQIKENIYYDATSARYRAENNNRYDELFKIIVDLVAGKRVSLRIGDTDYPQWLVRERMLSMTASDMEYVLDRIAEKKGEIHNMRKYMIATLFNAPTTKDNFYTQLMHHNAYSEMA